MNIKIIAVIGAGFGDEGKGLMTDYFADQLKTGYVVRHNSSAQAGHTVQLADGTRHVFSHFGSGTFAGLPTVLGHRFVVNPLIFRKEREELIAKGYTPEVYVHGDCMVTTPFDMLVNQMTEHSRDENRHGSCGVGFGETVERHENHSELVTLVHNDMSVWNKFTNRVLEIRTEWINRRIENLNLENPTVDKLYQIYHNDDMLNDYFDACNYFFRNVKIIHDYDLLTSNNVIFEGAQGLQLDQNSQNFPYVTRCNTGIKDVIEILDQIGNTQPLDVVYVSRCYTTKHGAGTLHNEQPFPEHLLGADQTNQPNEFQGTLRYAPLDLDAYYAVTMSDMVNANGCNYNVRAKTAFTWLDQNPTDLVIGNKVVSIPSDEFVGFLTSAIIYGSFGPTRQDVQQFNEIQVY